MKLWLVKWDNIYDGNEESHYEVVAVATSAITAEVLLAEHAKAGHRDQRHYMIDEIVADELP